MKLSQKSLGEAVGLSMQTINDIEKARSSTTLDRAIGLANYFNVSLDYLVGRNEKSNHNTSSLSADQNELLTLYNSLNDFSKGILIENARIMMEKQPKRLNRA